jgi:NTE family protein
MEKIAWVMSGGGARGAVQIGMMANLISKGITPHVIYGTSVGSLNGSALAYNDIEKIISIWSNLKERSDVLTFNWKFPFLIGDGFLKMNRLRKDYIDKFIHGVPHFEVKVCRTNLLTGETEYVSNQNVPIEKFRDAAQDSCTIPLFMEPRSDYMDGGLRDVIPLEKALDDGCTEIHVLTCNPWTKNPPPIKSIKKKLRFLRFYTFLQRSVDDVMNHDVKYNDLYCAYLRTKDNPNIKIKIYCPEFIISSTLEFNTDKIKKGIQHGYVVKPVDLKELFDA